MMSFGDWLKKELDKRGWAQAELARRSGVPQGQISNIIRGIRQPGPEPCIAIGQALGVSREEIFQARGWLLNGSEAGLKLRLSPEITQIAVRMDQLPSIQRQTAIQVTVTLIDALKKQVEPATITWCAGGNRQGDNEARRFMNFAEWLQQQLKKRGLRQAELSRRSTIPTGQLSRILNGIWNAGPEPCIALAQAFGLSREEVFRARGWLLSQSQEEIRLKLSSEAAEVAAEIDKLPSTSRQIALELAKATVQTLQSVKPAS